MSGEPDQGEHPPFGPIDRLTIPGRLLPIVTLAACAGGVVWYVLAIINDLPAGRYPVLFFVLPVALGGFLFFIAVAALLERLGVRVYRRNGES